VIELLWNAPVSDAKMSECIETLKLRPGQRVLDVGCGCGEVLIRLCERYEIRGTGIDTSPAYIAEARRRAQGRVSERSIHFVEADAQSFLVDRASLDLVMCIGATHAFGRGVGAFRNSIKRMIPMLIPGGMLLVGEGYMKRPASPEYRALLGDTIPDDVTHAVNVSTGGELGLIPLAAWTSNEDEWDSFEWTYQRIIERKAAERSDDDLTVKLAQRRAWMDAYLQWGRDSLGYGIYLFKVDT
jgi:cyclopropane fatty-acyl-phospholipid synthase-like methyltransferase